MQPNQQAKKKRRYWFPYGIGFSGTDAQKVKQEIRKDVSKGQGAMTSREAGAMRD
ncbi:hypothetical protein [Bacillus sp. S/N-304-OC-R1]|uniref:hypothetical protein n=1 Tax=Bacillus sp. S/N-304-OC-R1 TaxID=2758034 RepID=UPI001C8D3CDC|nr:hypothetical protein [Bacillus sp. S/N-304-OC-R1]MBY0122878.1 hypothetical protein [Bacillus sp. S/N-304-OC-R1]